MILYCFKSLGPIVADGPAVRVSAIAGRGWLSSTDPESSPTSDIFFSPYISAVTDDCIIEPSAVAEGNSLSPSDPSSLTSGVWFHSPC